MNNPLSFDAALPNLLTALDASGKVTAGTRYLNDATSGLLSDKAAQTLLNTAAQPAAAGASFYAVQAVRDFADEAQQRYSYLSQADVHPGEFYVKYGHRHTNMDGLQLTGLTAQASDNYNSVSVGYDFPVQGLYQSGLTVDYDVLGKGTYEATLGLEAESKTLGWSIGYRYQGNSEQDSHTFGAHIAWKF